MYFEGVMERVELEGVAVRSYSDIIEPDGEAVECVGDVAAGG